MQRNHFLKPVLTIAQQLDLLIQRGLNIPELPQATHYLKTVSYYRLSAYFKPFERKDEAQHLFKSGADFNQIWETYTFDRHLRLLLIDALERIEVALRAALTNVMACHYGSLWYLAEAPFVDKWFKGFSQN